MRARASLIGLALLGLATSAAAEQAPPLAPVPAPVKVPVKVAVKVIELAGEQAYLEPGRAAGLTPGTEVLLQGQRLLVTEATERTAAVRPGALRLAVGEVGSASVLATAQAEATAASAPRPAARWAGQWPEAVRPATTSQPQRVPLGARPRAGRLSLAVLGWASAAGDRDHQDAAGEARVLARYQTERALALELDVAARAYSAGFDAARPPVLVRAAELRLGPSEAPRLRAGRLRYAASAVGLLDGARASLERGPLSLAAFGGIAPAPQSGKPTPQAARFGTELSYRLERARWQPQLTVTAHGSTWEGSLDERKLSAAISAGGERTWIDGWAEAQGFDAQNPWGAARVEVVGAGAAARLRTATSHAGLDLSFLRPDRSARLAAALPLELLCLPVLEVGDVATRCAGGQWWASASASGGTRRGPWALDAIAALGYERSAATGSTRSLSLRGARALGALRLDAEVSAGKARFASFTGAGLGASYAFAARTELTLRYRPELIDYTASAGPALLHVALAEARLAPLASLELVTSALAQLGADQQTLALWLSLSWRPLP